MPRLAQDRTPITGTSDPKIRLERRKCGKKNCKCADGVGHGPYFYRVRSENGKVKREYLGGPFTPRQVVRYGQ